MDSSNGTGPTGPNDIPINSNNNNNFNPLNSSGNQQILQQGQQQPQQQQFPMILPPNFDLNALSPADRELFLRRFQLQQQQLQQQQMHRARQAAQVQNFQRMTLNAYSTPRPPLNQQSQPQAPVSNATQTFFVNPMMNIVMPPQVVPMNHLPMEYQNYPINRPPPTLAQNSINPALLQLQPGGTIKPSTPTMTQINPQQFTNPLKSDPVLYSMNTGNNSSNNPPPASNTLTLNIPPLDEQVLSSEGNFIDHLIKFYDCIKFTNRVVPQISQRPLSLFRLFQVVNSGGGFLAVGDAKKWPLVAQALQLPGNSYDVVATIRATYYTFLYTYEQYFIQKKTLDKIDWPSQAKQQPQQQMPTQNQQRPPTQPQIPSHPQTPIPQIPAVFTPQALKFIPETDLPLWKPFADAMKIPIGLINDLDTAILYLKSPYLTLKIEALLATQKLFTQATAKELQSAGASSDSLANLFEALESVWSTEGLKCKPTPFKTMEDFWSQVDNEKRDLTKDRQGPNKNLMICRQIVSLIRILAVTKGTEVCQFLAQSDFIRQKLFPFSLMESDDMELYKDTLIIYESISPHLNNLNDSLLKWTLKQCETELKQVRNDRLTSLSAKFIGTITLDRISSFENISIAKQTVALMISQGAQLWKCVPSHIFLHLSASLNILTLSDSIDLDLTSFCNEIVEFTDLFVFPTVAFLRSFRGLLEKTMNSLTSPVEELRKLLETVIYSPLFSLTDGGFMEICLQLISKCQMHQSDCLNSINWTGIYCLLRELRDFWRHSDCQQHVPYLGKTCYAVPNMANTASPAKKTMQNNQKLQLAILNGSNSISSVFSHPFPLLLKSLNLLVVNFHILPPKLQFDLLELAVEWNLATPSQWGREVLGCERIENLIIKLVREFYF